MSLRSPGRSGQYRSLPGNFSRGWRWSLSYRQLVWLTAIVLGTGLLTLGPSLATLDTISSPGSRDGHDSFPSPVTDAVNVHKRRPSGVAGDKQRRPGHASHQPASGQTAPAAQQRWLSFLRAHPPRGAVPVDVVYLWVNGSDPELQQELQRFRPASSKPAAVKKPPVPRKPTAPRKPVPQQPSAAKRAHSSAASSATKHSSAATAAVRPAARHLLAADSTAAAAHGPTPQVTAGQTATAQPPKAPAGGSGAHVTGSTAQHTATQHAPSQPAAAQAVKATPPQAAAATNKAATGAQPGATPATKATMPGQHSGTAADKAAAAGPPATQPPVKAAAAAVRPAVRPAVPPAGQPAVRPAVQPAGQPAPRPAGQPAQRPAGQPAAAGVRPAVRPAGQPAPAKAAAKPSVKPAPAAAKPPVTKKRPAAKRPVPLPLTELPTRVARFDAGRDELRYSLRSLEQHLPWYRHLYIVTNGQVPSWLDLSNPRVTLVPHSSIFRNASHLPTFNSNAIQANLANIPGLSPHFIMMDDDLFLTASWSRQDFLAPDDGQVLTGTALATNMTGKLPMYMKSIQRLNSIFVKQFGAWRRYLPAHSPHFLEVEWLRKLQGALPVPFQQTSGAHLRSADDVVLAAAYQWYVSQYQPGQHPTAPNSRSSFVSLSNYLAKCYMVAAVNDNRFSPQAAMYRQKIRQTRPLNPAINAEYRVAIETALQAAAAGKPPGKYMLSQHHNHTAELSKTWDQAGVKMVCLNDDVDDLYAPARPLFNPIVVKFLAARYPKASQYELPAGRVNNCRRIKTKGFGHLPTAAEIAAACNRPPANRRGMVLPYDVNRPLPGGHGATQ